MALTKPQIDEMIRLRRDEQLTQEQIAQRLGVGMYTVKRHWGYIPAALKSQLRNGSAGRRVTAKRVIPEEKHLPLTGGKCPCCEFHYTADNPRVQGGWCLLCQAQALGRVVMYADIAEVAT